MEASVSSIETFGLVDGPGIRTVVFFNGCKLRCKFCHNPEMQKMLENNMTLDELYKKIIRSKPYFKNNGGVTFSGGEPLLHIDFLIPLCKKLKEDNIHICLDTAGVGLGEYEELLKYIDIVILDIKDYRKEYYKDMTGHDIDDFNYFLSEIQRLNKKIWIRQVVTPGYTDSMEYMEGLKKYINNIKNVERIELLPYHTMAIDKYKKLNIKYELEGVPEMDKDKCSKLELYLNQKEND